MFVYNFGNLDIATIWSLFFEFLVERYPLTDGYQSFESHSDLWWTVHNDTHLGWKDWRYLSIPFRIRALEITD